MILRSRSKYESQHSQIWNSSYFNDGRSREQLITEIRVNSILLSLWWYKDILDCRYSPLQAKIYLHDHRLWVTNVSHMFMWDCWTAIWVPAGTQCWMLHKLSSFPRKTNCLIFNFPMHFTDWYLQYVLWICLHISPRTKKWLNQGQMSSSVGWIVG